jgi:hypothetical protein
VERFASVEQLQEQLDRDRVRALAALAGNRTDPNRVTHA